ncbi:hypothetical protein CEXT_461991 [Caerostris extrusa]|uniref:Uncharacterized protein n=1 Tax=Caerostris extrusa TaxID=172846 RepID=A0AAV4NY25_CAEEX|nr:hypothetical protein CEXT_461991 [Caerostris extrusa]
MVANLEEKKMHLVEWVGRYGSCPIVHCNIHNAKNLKIKAKRNASEITSTNDKAKHDFKFPSKKHTAEADFTSNNSKNNSNMNISNKFSTLSTVVNNDDSDNIVV